MSSKPHDEQSPGRTGRCSETNGLDKAERTIRNTQKKHKAYCRLIRHWVKEGKLSPDAAQKALEFIQPQLVSV
jgi:hypothetical protein